MCLIRVTLPGNKHLGDTLVCLFVIVLATCITHRMFLVTIWLCLYISSRDTCWDSKLGHDRSLPHPFQFTHVSFFHSTLYSLSYWKRR
jgi:hypothetical protein